MILGIIMWNDDEINARSAGWLRHLPFCDDTGAITPELTRSHGNLAVTLVP
jgi:hypothetical protein